MTTPTEEDDFQTVSYNVSDVTTPREESYDWLYVMIGILILIAVIIIVIQIVICIQCYRRRGEKHKKKPTSEVSSKQSSLDGKGSITQLMEQNRTSKLVLAKFKSDMEP